MGRRRNRQTVVFSKGPPPPLDFVDDDLPVCDSSGQVQISLGEEDQQKLQGKRSLRKMAMASTQQAAKKLKAKTAKTKTKADNGGNPAMASTLVEQILNKPAVLISSLAGGP